MDSTTLDESGYAGGRVITYLPLPPLNVFDWFREYFVPKCTAMWPNVIDDRIKERVPTEELLRLFLLTGGRPREMQFVLEALYTTADRQLSWDALVQSVRPPVMKATQHWFECLFPAFTNIVLPLRVDSGQRIIPSEFANWIKSGVTVNDTHGVDEPVAAAPIVSLYRLFHVTFLPLPTLTNFLELLARRETDGHIFERLWQLHTALLLQIHRHVRIGASLQVPKLLEWYIPLPRTLKLLSTRQQSAQALFKKVKIVRQQLPTLNKLHIDARFCDMSLNGTLDCEGFNLWTATTSQLLLKFDHVLVNLHEKNEAFDSALLVKQVTDDENGTPHLLCFENKLRSDSVRLRDLKSKVDLFNKHLNKLVGEAGADTALRAAGLHQKQQFTLIFVVLGKVSNKVIGALERHCVNTPFNVVLMDEDAVIAHFGASFEPCVWLCKTIASNEE